MSYQCLKCFELFDDPAESSESLDDMYDRATYRVALYACPCCGSQNLDEVCICDTCNERRVADGYDECAECAAITEAREYEHRLCLDAASPLKSFELAEVCHADE